MRCCEDQQVDYVFGLAKNKRLMSILGKELHQAQQAFEATGSSVQGFQLSHQLPLDARQSIAAVAVERGLRAAGGPVPTPSRD